MPHSRDPAVWRSILLLLLGCCLSTVQPAAAQPACPINSPNITIAPGDTIPTFTGDSVFMLNGTGTFYIAADATIWTAGVTICILGSDRDGTVLKIANQPTGQQTHHVRLNSGTTLFLASLTLDGGCENGATDRQGGISTPFQTGPNRTLKTNSVRFTNCAGVSAEEVGFEAALHNTVFVNNFRRTGSGAAAITCGAYWGASTTQVFTFTGSTLFQGNEVRNISVQSPGQSAGALSLVSQLANRISFTFDGDVKFLNNVGTSGGAIYVAGGVSVLFKGAVLQMAGNVATGQTNMGSAASGGAISVWSPLFQASGDTILEFSSDATMFSDNSATTTSPAGMANGGALAIGFAASTSSVGRTARVSFANSVVFRNNSVISNADIAAGGGAVHLILYDGLGTLRMEVKPAAVVTFEDNRVTGNKREFYRGGAMRMSNNKVISNTPTNASMSQVVVDPTARLVFVKNTAGGVEQDVVIDDGVNGGGSSGSIVCGTNPPKLGGFYRVACDMCLSCSNITAGGVIDTCQSPSVCYADCVAEPPTPTAIPNGGSAGWNCPALPSYTRWWHEASCLSSCNAGFVGTLTATCFNGIWTGTTGSCSEQSTTAGCSAAIPTNPGTTGYTSCSNSPSAGEYPLGTACQAVCASGGSGGFAKCSFGPSGTSTLAWQVTPCKQGCSGSPPGTVGVVWQCGGASTVAGGACSGACDTAAGFAGPPTTAVCNGPAWSDATTGTACTRVACIGPPPGSPPPNTTFQCTSTPVGQPCKATCAPGLTGSLQQLCLADGTWGLLEGDTCVDCAANKPTLAVTGPTSSAPEGSTAVSATFVFRASYIKGPTALQATIDGLAGCSTEPTELTGAAAGATINVTCLSATGFTVGLHTIVLTATFSGGNICSGGSLTALGPVSVAQTPVPAPTVQLEPAAAVAPPACKAAAGPTEVSAVFTYQVTAADGALQSSLVLDATEVCSSAPSAICNSRQQDGLENGTLTVTCSGTFDGLSSLVIRATLKASTGPGTLVGTATSSQDVAFVCCSPAGSVAQAVNTTAGSACLTCGTATAVDGVVLLGELESGAMRAGSISPGTCASNGPNVGVISAVCDADNKWLLRVTVLLTNQPGGPPGTLQYVTRCNGRPANGPSCTAGGYAWRTVNAKRNGLQVSTTPAGTKVEFGILQTSYQPSCACGRFYWSVKAAGSWVVGPVDSAGACPATARTVPARLTSKTRRNGGG